MVRRVATRPTFCTTLMFYTRNICGELFVKSRELTQISIAIQLTLGRPAALTTSEAMWTLLRRWSFHFSPRLRSNMEIELHTKANVSFSLFSLSFFLIQNFTRCLLNRQRAADEEQTGNLHSQVSGWVWCEFKEKFSSSEQSKLDNGGNLMKKRKKIDILKSQRSRRNLKFLEAKF